VHLIAPGDVDADELCVVLAVVDHENADHISLFHPTFAHSTLLSDNFEDASMRRPCSSMLSRPHT
jgi:hypothetical protein